MASEAQSPFWRRRYRADEAGICELDWGGNPRKFIAWHQITRIDHGRIYSDEGVRIGLPLENKMCVELLGAIHAQWKLRFPLAWRTERARNHRRLQGSLFIWTPLTVLVPWMIIHAEYALLAHLGAPREGIQGINRLALLGVLPIGAMWLLYFRWKRQGVYDN
jgi:hypothetical protein